MSRYIEADALMADLDKGLWGKDYDKALAEAIISDAPSIDICFCEECKWFGEGTPIHLKDGELLEDNYCTRPNQQSCLLKPNDFCSYGERIK